MKSTNTRFQCFSKTPVDGVGKLLGPDKKIGLSTTSQELLSVPVFGYADCVDCMVMAQAEEMLERRGRIEICVPEATKDERAKGEDKGRDDEKDRRKGKGEAKAVDLSCEVRRH